MAAKPNKLKATPAAKKPVKKAAAKKPAPKKAVKKAPAKKAVAKTPVPAKAGKTVKKAAVKKAVAKKAVKKVAVKKAAAKTVAKKPVARKTAAAAKTTPRSSVHAPIYVPTPSPAPAAPKPAHVAPAPAQPAISLKGLRGVSGAKAARIAQIVAESFLPKAAEPAPETSRPAATLNTDTLVASPEASSEALTAAHKAAAVLFSKKAEDVVLMDLRNLSTVADYYLIATCTNEPQMRSILGTVQRSLSREGIKSLRSEHMSGARWAVIDYGDLIVHLFEKQTRGYYSLERLWADAPSTTLKAEDYSLPDEADADEDGDL